MKIKPFAVEEWMNAYETGASYNIAETCVDSLSPDDLFALAGTDRRAFLDGFCSRRLTYGDIEGAPAFRRGICSLYKTLGMSDVIPTHGAAGANHHIFYSLIEPGDHVISVMPTYQQLYSIPEGYGARVDILKLRPENSWLPDPDELKAMCSGGVSMICINNPNNPTGALMSDGLLREIAGIADSCGAWLLCDEVYRGLSQSGVLPASVADLYEKGISVNSMSKVFSLAGLRLGWLATRNKEARKACLSHRDYNHISCGMFDETLAALALEHKEAILERNLGLLRTNLAILDEWVKGEPHMDYVKPEAGTTALVSWDLGMQSYEFCERLYRETGAFVTPGDCFGEERCMRIGYGCDTRTLKDGLDAISSFVRSLER